MEEDKEKGGGGMEGMKGKRDGWREGGLDGKKGVGGGVTGRERRVEIVWLMLDYECMKK